MAARLMVLIFATPCFASIDIYLGTKGGLYFPSGDFHPKSVVFDIGGEFGLEYLDTLQSVVGYEHHTPGDQVFHTFYLSQYFYVLEKGTFRLFLGVGTSINLIRRKNLSTNIFLATSPNGTFPETVIHKSVKLGYSLCLGGEWRFREFSIGLVIRQKLIINKPSRVGEGYNLFLRLGYRF